MDFVRKALGAAGALVTPDGRVLLVRRAYPPHDWVMPGGNADALESPVETFRREVREEVGLTVAPTRMTGVYYHPDHHAGEYLHFVFEAFIDADPPVVVDPSEVAEWGLFETDALPEPMSQSTRIRLTDAVAATPPRLPVELPPSSEPRSVTPHHLYVHVPFCRLVCAYCDFVTVGGRGQEIDRYVAALTRELALRPAPGELRTVYLGGGTPSLLSAEQVASLLDAARDRWPGATPEEVTLEANPSERERPDWAGLRTAGVTRISLGVQSLDDADLRALARGHEAREAREAYGQIRAAGIDNVSIDLIYGIPGQSSSRWECVLREAIALSPDHLSLYALQLALAPDEWAAPPRRGALRWRQRVATEQDDDLAADQYRLAEEVLDAAGYEHYELSSWARPGRQSRHNAAYWARRAYTGIGAGAHSYDGARERSWNARDLDEYLARAEAGERPVADREELDEPTRAFEAIALGLRRVAGIGRADFADEFGADPIVRFPDAVAAGVERDLLEVTDHTLRLSPWGRLLANEALEPFAP